MTATLDTLLPMPRPREQGFPLLDADRLLADHLALPALVRETWQQLVRETVRNDRASALHAARAEFRTIADEWQRQADEFAQFCRRLGVPDVTARAEEAADQVRAFYADLFAKWTSEEGLLGLMVEAVSLPQSQLEGYARRHPIPQAWFDENFDGLFADDADAPHVIISPSEG